jgi:hypothetical protein
MFACHKTAEGREIACAGWLAVEGVNHVGVRLAVAQDRCDADALTPDPNWPALYDSFNDMASANGVVPDPALSPSSARGTESTQSRRHTD